MTQQQIDLDKPKDAKLFLRGIRIHGKEVTQVILEGGKILNIEDMSGEQLVRYAKEIYFDFFGGIEGEGGYIDLEIAGQNQ